MTEHRVRHGEAVGIGIALDTTYSWLAGFLPEVEWRRVIGLIGAIGVPVYTPELGVGTASRQDPASVLAGLTEFRQHLGGQLTVMLLKGIGQAFEVNDLQTDLILRSIQYLKTFEADRRLPVAKKAS
jgi:3-dehydroquinate synthase